MKSTSPRACASNKRSGIAGRPFPKTITLSSAFPCPLVMTAALLIQPMAGANSALTGFIREVANPYHATKISIRSSIDLIE